MACGTVHSIYLIQGIPPVLGIWWWGMVPMSSSESRLLDDQSRGLLVQVAWDSIRHGLINGRPAPIHLESFPASLRAPGAAFVTLHAQGALRGCIGHLEATGPLVEDVAANAFAAAFRDPRFPPLVEQELTALDLEVSVLSAPESIGFKDEDDLLAQLRPGTDGLILEDRGARATFLPAVWDILPTPSEFLAELKHKAGLPRDHFSDTLRIRRYRTEVCHG